MNYCTRTRRVQNKKRAKNGAHHTAVFPFNAHKLLSPNKADSPQLSLRVTHGNPPQSSAPSSASAGRPSVAAPCTRARAGAAHASRQPGLKKGSSLIGVRVRVRVRVRAGVRAGVRAVVRVRVRVWG